MFYSVLNLLSGLNVGKQIWNNGSVGFPVIDIKIARSQIISPAGTAFRKAPVLGKARVELDMQIDDDFRLIFFDLAPFCGAQLQKAEHPATPIWGNEHLTYDLIEKQSLRSLAITKIALQISYKFQGRGGSGIKKSNLKSNSGPLRRLYNLKAGFFPIYKRL